MSRALPEGWIPCSVSGTERPFAVDFVHLGRERLTGPFFNDDIQQRMRRPFHQLVRFRRTLDELVELAERRPGIPPTGFIFHMSRCGSTLVSQMLAAVPRHVVLSEAPPIDTVLQLDRRDPSVSEADRIRWLRAMISALGQPREGGEDRLFVKLDSWHTLFLPLFRRAYPDVPWIFLYRNPLEVLVSQARMRGSQMIPGVLPFELLGISPQWVGQLTLDGYAAKVLAAVCEAAVRNLDEKGKLVSYAQLPELVSEGLPAHFGIALDAQERALMREASLRNAKSPRESFAPDAAAKQAEATAALEALAAQELSGIHARLESLRAR